MIGVCGLMLRSRELAMDGLFTILQVDGIITLGIIMELGMKTGDGK